MAESSNTTRSLSLLVDKHVEYIKSLDKRQDELEYWMTEHLRISGIYWGLVALKLLDRDSALDKQQVIDYILSCQNTDGGFGGHCGHDSHLLYTMSAVQVLSMYGALDKIESSRVVDYVISLQDIETGEICGDEWGERDTRFAFIAVAILSFFGALSRLDSDRIVEYVVRSMNYDGGFGSGPGGESHAAQVYTCLACLAILGRLDVVDRERLSAWLAERQLPSGGFNGRPQKLEDVCYSWWVLSSLRILGRVHWVDCSRVCNFVLDAQEPDSGGIADRPGNVPDVYHTCFGIAGLSLAGYEDYPLKDVDPVYCMPIECIESSGLRSWINNVPKSWSQEKS
ncbi:prenyltransferase and squalene oxidase [Coemansia reversa NRRL 1564]|uniref:Geranylgeranyl transferase type-2 subunit beta n=1 Tax=Coemansia reversa (strain ATCC 12441 / NRRL 1564) TaxID=763665 RepID=A0A2G5BIN0_COERN|nr:prenyltransferase and squalene oxidase [Coemansia reversa NRRL 1564]|eukprot:PIA18841.1 prenyltransferase and squalene oxidase [Coemansia reversa NRRL 1564]